jgi:hypothetical protein
LRILLFIYFLLSPIAYAEEIKTKRTLEVFGVPIMGTLDKTQIDDLRSKEKHNKNYDLYFYEIKRPKKETNLSKLFDEFIVVTAFNLISKKETVYQVLGISNTCNNIFKIKDIMDNIDLSNDDMQIVDYVFNVDRNSRYLIYNQDKDADFVIDVICFDDSENPYIELSASYFKDDFLRQ